MPSPPYIGRFAPSPTGPLHFGSLATATASYLDALASRGQWLVRIEDLDREREQPGAADSILRDLEALGFAWHGSVIRQSARTGLYRDAFDHLQRLGKIYACSCSRKEIADSQTGEMAGLRYPGTCREGIKTDRAPSSWRVRTVDEFISFADRVQGPYAQNLAAIVGDFVLKRVEGVREAYTYQLAVVVDDAAQGVTHVVRGADLLDSTPRQVYLQRLLSLVTPDYAHVPVVVDADGNKLSKQTRATALDLRNPALQLARTLRFLGQQPPDDLGLASVPELWDWAIANWSLASVPKVPALRSSGEA